MAGEARHALIFGCGCSDKTKKIVDIDPDNNKCLVGKHRLLPKGDDFECVSACRYFQTTGVRKAVVNSRGLSIKESLDQMSEKCTISDISYKPPEILPEEQDWYRS